MTGKVVGNHVDSVVFDLVAWGKAAIIIALSLLLITHFVWSLHYAMPFRWAELRWTRGGILIYILYHEGAVEWSIRELIEGRKRSGRDLSPLVEQSTG